MPRIFLRFSVLAVSLALIAFAGFSLAAPKAKSKLRLKSTSFQDGHMIPDKYTCKGQNISPELNWKDPPEGTKCFAIVCVDPDAALKSWVHWVIFNIPAQKDPDKDTYELLEGFPRQEKTTEGIFQGSNDFEKIGYDGPCPPNGLHEYFFKLYALDGPVKLPAGISKDQLLKAMDKHILAWTQIMGLYGQE